MRNILTILRRELANYFNSPIGYIFTFVFVALNIWMFQISFFSNPSANMRTMFQILPFILIIFVPLVTMRLWAEERKENTIEMLLTFPMKSHQLVLGKYFAGVTFFAISLLGTFSLPIMLGSLGNPDWGVIFSSYLGALLLGGLFLAVGIFVSGLVKDQIVAAVLSLGSCFFLYIFGLEFIVSSIDTLVLNITGINTNIGKILKDFLTVTAHYEPFIKGIVPVASLVYFLVWTCLFLFLNGLFLEGRSRKGYKTSFAFSVILCGVIGVASNYLLEGIAVGRWDVTEHKSYTISPVTEKYLSELEGEVNIKLYISQKDELPVILKNLEQEVRDKLEEIRINSDGKLRFSVVHMNVKKLAQEEGEQTKEEESLEKSLLKKGVEPFRIGVGGQTKRSTQMIFSSMGISYMDNKEEFIPRVLPQAIEELEFLVMSIIYRQTREKKTVALVVPRWAVTPDTAAAMMQMGRPVPPSDYLVIQRLLEYYNYDVKLVELSEQSPLPENFDSLIILSPRNLNERQKWEISRALHNGKNVILAVQNYHYQYVTTNGSQQINREEVKPEVNDWLNSYGIKVDKQLLMSENNFPWITPTSNGPRYLIEMPNQMVITSETMNQKSPITNRIDQIRYLWGSAILVDEEVLKENKLKNTLLMHVDSAWKLPETRALSEYDSEAPLDGLQSYPVITLLEGQFPNLYDGDNPPEWEKAANNPLMPQRPPAPQKIRSANPKPAKLLVLGGARIFSEEFLQDGMKLFLNAVDVFTGGGELSTIRSKSVMPRTISKVSESDKTFWWILNYFVIPFLIIIIGILRLQVRRVTRDQYTMSVE